MTPDQPVGQIPSQPLEPAVHTRLRAPYTRPTLEMHGAFLVVTGCSLGGGCVPINDLLESDGLGEGW